MESKEKLRKQWDKMHGRQWIPVSERLPDEDDPVLVSWDGCMVGIAWITKRGNWRDTEGKFPRTVTHWMPLPEPQAT